VTGTELALVVPCYNEAARLDVDAFVRFITTHTSVRLVLVDDGSVDGTSEVLERIRVAAPDAVTALRLGKNQGKGEAVRAGILAAMGGNPAIVGFFDADLSTPLDAVDDFLALLRKRPDVEFVRFARHADGAQCHTQGHAALSRPGLRDGGVPRAGSSCLRHPVWR
jgi:glycosyltransferase involved in cell wall biosynthesis